MLNNRASEFSKEVKMKIVTMQDVADKCNLSVTTVSNVLNNKGHFSPITRDKVMNTAIGLGYLIDYSLYTDKLVALKISETMEKTVRQELITFLSSVAFSMRIELQLAQSDRYYPAMLAIGEFTKKQESDLREHANRLILVADKMDLDLGPVRTANILMETLIALKIEDPVIIYDSDYVFDSFAVLNGYDSLNVSSMSDDELFDELDKFKKRTFVLLCPDNCDKLFSVLERLKDRGLLILVDYTGQRYFDDRNLRYLRFDIYDLSAVAQILTLFSQDIKISENFVLKQNIFLIGGM